MLCFTLKDYYSQTRPASFTWVKSFFHYGITSQTFTSFIICTSMRAVTHKCRHSRGNFQYSVSKTSQFFGIFIEKNIYTAYQYNLERPC